MNKEQTFNELKNSLTEKDIAAILAIIGKRCHIKTILRLRSVLTYGTHLIRPYGILNRLTKDETGWSYCAGQDYREEIKTVRSCILD